MITANNDMLNAVRDLRTSGADAFLIEQMYILALEQGMQSESVRDDREFRALMDAIKVFDREVQAVINSMVDM